MNNLAIEYRKNGYNYRQVSREGDVAIYSQHGDNDKLIAYEVFIVQKNKEATMPNGKIISARETPPSSEQWGIQAFTVHELPDARAKAALLANRIAQRQNQPSL